MPTIINSVTDLKANWNNGYGVDNDGIFIIASNLYIGASDLGGSPTFPLPYNATIDVKFGGPLQSSPNIITIDISSSNSWSGLFALNTSNTITIENLQFTILSAYLSQGQSAFFFTGGVNPSAIIEKVFVSVSPVNPGDVIYDANWGGFICALDIQKTGSTIQITDCVYSGSLGIAGGGFIANGYIGGGGTNMCNIALTNCFSYISIDGSPINAGGLCGGRMCFHNTTVTGCVVQFSKFGSSDYIGGFYGYESNSFNVSDSYVIVTDSISTTTFGWITTSLRGDGNPSAVSNSYFVCEIYPSPLNTYNYISGAGDSLLEVSNCAFQIQNVGHVNSTKPTSANNIIDYTYSSPTIGYQPFYSWNTSTVWSPGPTATPLILNAFTGIPFQGYTEANDVPTLTDLCIFEGTKILTTKGYVPVEDITEDHVLCTYAGHTTRITAIYRFVNPSTPCYKIAKNSMGENLPHDDVYLSGQHAVYKGVDDIFIHPSHWQDFFPHEKARVWGKSRYYCIETEDYYNDLLVASGLPIEGFGKSVPDHHTWKCTLNENPQCVMVKI